MGHKAVLHTLRFSFLLTLLGLFWLAPSVISAKNSTEHEKNTSLVVIDVTFTVTHVSCNGGNNGAITATASGGVGPYTFQWSNGGTSATITGLTAGFYTVIVKDATQASVTGQAEVQTPLPVGAGAAQLQGQLCQFQPNGIGLAYAWGGTPFPGTNGYTYLWSNGQTGDHATGLAAGTYTVTATDSKGCKSPAASLTINDNTAEGIWISMNNDLVCPGQLGMLHAGAMSGVPPYSYNWTGPGGFTFSSNTTGDITGLQPGTYHVTISDASGCSGVLSAQVVAGPAVTVSVTSTNAACNSNNGTATATPGGGSGGYIITWSNGQGGANISGLAAGTVVVTVTDSEGCSATASVTIGGGSTVNVSANATSNATCTGGGSATATASGGTAPITFSWDGGVFSSNPSITGLSAGGHSVTAKDANGCTATANVNISGPAGLPSVTATVISNASCTTLGSATATASGGAGSYSFQWSASAGNQTTATATNLPAGNHSVVVTDGAGCMATASVNIQQTGGPTVSANAISNATCTTGGSATVNVFGGTTPYSFKWSPSAGGQTTQTATNLAPGQHFVTVTDGGGCTSSAAVTISGPSNLPMATISINSAANCTGIGGGVATVMASGGSGGYTFLWSPSGQTTMSATNLNAGPISVTVTDNSGCSAIASVTMPSIPGPSVSVVVNSNAVCNAGGSATATATGGSGTYSFKWSASAGGQTTATATNLPAGTHSVVVTDGNGCIGAGVAIITATNGTVAITTIVNTNAVCDVGGSATATAAGGIAPYSYVWSNGQTTATLTNVASGGYIVTATDAAGCTAMKTVSIGNTPGTKIGDFVWYDDSQNGFQDAAETNVLAGATVKLQTAGADNNFGTADDVTVKTTTTDGAGKYLFDCVPPGTYILKFEGLPPGYQWAKKNAVNNDCLDSDVNATGRTDAFTIVAGQPDNFCWDAGIHTICDNVISPGAVCCDQTICEGETPAQLYNSLFPFGGTGTIEYQWLQLVQVGQAPPTWVGIAGATSKDYQPGALFETTKYMRCARRAGCVGYLESNIITITVKPLGSPGCPFFYVSINGNIINSYAEIEWITPPEHSELTYQVEHSMDKLNWELIGSTPGQQIGSQNNVYKLNHTTPLVGQNFYRVKRFNRLGEESISEIVSVDMHMGKMESVKFWPVPANDELYVQNLMIYGEPVSIDLFDPTGKFIRTITLPEKVITKEKIDLSQSPSGLFLARIRFAEGETTTIKIPKIDE